MYEFQHFQEEIDADQSTVSMNFNIPEHLEERNSSQPIHREYELQSYHEDFEENNYSARISKETSNKNLLKNKDLAQKVKDHQDFGEDY